MRRATVIGGPADGREINVAEHVKVVQLIEADGGRPTSYPYDVEQRGDEWLLIRRRPEASS